MKKLAIGVIAAMAFSALSFISFAAPKVGTFSGEIMDSQCALLGSHDRMIQPGQTEKECSDTCVKIGGKYVLYDGATKTTYALDDQKMAAKFSGAKAKVTGDLNESTKAIKVTAIKAG